jgi:hypothetical protein
LKLGTLGCFLTIALGSALAGPIPLATYQFNNTTSADQSGVPGLNLVLDGTANSAYVTDTVFGESRTVLQLNGGPPETMPAFPLIIPFPCCPLPTTR